MDAKIKKYIKEYHKEYYQRPYVRQRHANYCKKYHKEYIQRLEVKKRINKYMRIYQKERKRKSKEYMFLVRLRDTLRDAIKIYSKNGKIMSSKKYGIDYKKIIEHLQPFPKDIKNYHIDHIIPLSWFDFNNSKEIQWAFAPENHQWLTKEENLWKGNRFIWVKT